MKKWKHMISDSLGFKLPRSKGVWNGKDDQFYTVTPSLVVLENGCINSWTIPPPLFVVQSQRITISNYSKELTSGLLRDFLIVCELNEVNILQFINSLWNSSFLCDGQTIWDRASIKNKAHVPVRAPQQDIFGIEETRLLVGSELLLPDLSENPFFSFPSV